MAKLMGIDLETTGRDDNLEVIEVGAVGYSTHHNQPLSMYSELSAGTTTPIDPEVRELTSIRDDMLGDGYLFPTANGINIMANLIAHIKEANPDFLVAHNAFGFEKPILEAAANYANESFNYNWIDTMIDIPYPAHKTSAGKSLIGLCATHDIINPYQHRALPDALVMMKLLGKYENDFPLIEKVAETPMVWVRAGVDRSTKDLAKNEDFLWDFVNICWVKQIRLYWLDKTKYPFTTVIMPDDYTFRK